MLLSSSGKEENKARLAVKGSLWERFLRTIAGETQGPIYRWSPCCGAHYSKGPGSAWQQDTDRIQYGWKRTRPKSGREEKQRTSLQAQAITPLTVHTSKTVCGLCTHLGRHTLTFHIMKRCIPLMQRHTRIIQEHLGEGFQINKTYMCQELNCAPKKRCLNSNPWGLYE